MRLIDPNGRRVSQSGFTMKALRGLSDARAAAALLEGILERRAGTQPKPLVKLQADFPPGTWAKAQASEGAAAAAVSFDPGAPRRSLRERAATPPHNVGHMPSFESLREGEGGFTVQQQKHRLRQSGAVMGGATAWTSQRVRREAQAILESREGAARLNVDEELEDLVEGLSASVPELQQLVEKLEKLERDNASLKRSLAARKREGDKRRKSEHRKYVSSILARRRARSAVFDAEARPDVRRARLRQERHHPHMPESGLRLRRVRGVLCQVGG